MNDTTPLLNPLTELTASIVEAYVSRNPVSPSDLPSLISATYGALEGLNRPADAPEADVQLKPPVPIRKSVTPDYLLSLEDGRQYKSLKRHLSTKGLTPEEYRAKWGLPSDYPMVAPSYAAKRSELARSSGLGRKREVVEPAPQEGGKPKRKKIGLRI